MSVNVTVTCKSRQIEPFAKKVAAMAFFKVAMGSRYITFSKNGTESAVSG